MKMRELDNLVIPPNGQAQFTPGGKHLMMKGPRVFLQSGESVDLTLIFDSGVRQTVAVRVAAKRVRKRPPNTKKGPDPIGLTPFCLLANRGDREGGKDGIPAVRFQANSVRTHRA
ncbi:MAG: copper chaperone PCu(A)C [Verrucomicrobia bacterium]|nr:copper chaperone PCu(A)C [Verrucomicrobiota bacterium]